MSPRRVAQVGRNRARFGRAWARDLSVSGPSKAEVGQVSGPSLSDCEPNLIEFGPNPMDSGPSLVGSRQILVEFGICASRRGVATHLWMTPREAMGCPIKENQTRGDASRYAHGLSTNFEQRGEVPGHHTHTSSNLWIRQCKASSSVCFDFQSFGHAAASAGSLNSSGIRSHTISLMSWNHIVWASLARCMVFAVRPVAGFERCPGCLFNGRSNPSFPVP